MPPTDEEMRTHEFNEEEFHRAYFLLAVYAHELIRRQEYMPESIWRGQMKGSDDFDETVADLVARELVLKVDISDGSVGYAITESGQALVWLYSDVIRDVWKKNMNGEGDALIDYLVASLDAYANEVRQQAIAAREQENASGQEAAE